MHSAYTKQIQSNLLSASSRDHALLHGLFPIILSFSGVLCSPARRGKYLPWIWSKWIGMRASRDVLRAFTFNENELEMNQKFGRFKIILWLYIRTRIKVHYLLLFGQACNSIHFLSTTTINYIDNWTRTWFIIYRYSASQMLFQLKSKNILSPFFSLLKFTLISWGMQELIKNIQATLNNSLPFACYSNKSVYNVLIIIRKSKRS